MKNFFLLLLLLLCVFWSRRKKFGKTWKIQIFTDSTWSSLQKNSIKKSKNRPEEIFCCWRDSFFCQMNKFLFKKTWIIAACCCCCCCTMLLSSHIKFEMRYKKWEREREWEREKWNKINVALWLVWISFAQRLRLQCFVVVSPFYCVYLMPRFCEVM